MRTFDWDRHEAQRVPSPSHRIPWLIKLIPLPFIAWCVFLLWYAMQHPMLTGFDKLFLPALSWAGISIFVWALLCMGWMRLNNPQGWRTFKTVANAALAIYWTDKAIHGLVNHYAPDHDDD